MCILNDRQVEKGLHILAFKEVMNLVRGFNSTHDWHLDVQNNHFIEVPWLFLHHLQSFKSIDCGIYREESFEKLYISVKEVVIVINNQ